VPKDFRATGSTTRLALFVEPRLQAVSESAFKARNALYCLATHIFGLIACYTIGRIESDKADSLFLPPTTRLFLSWGLLLTPARSGSKYYLTPYHFKDAISSQNHEAFAAVFVIPIDLKTVPQH
jgi:hypothetical protein